MGRLAYYAYGKEIIPPTITFRLFFWFLSLHVKLDKVYVDTRQLAKC